MNRCLSVLSCAGLPSTFPINILLYAGLLIFRRKKSKISRDFQGKIRGKIGRFRRIFAEKSQYLRKNRPILQNFCGRKVKFHRKTGRFRGILAEKVKFRRIFRGKFLEKSADFTGNFAMKQSVKNCRFRWIFFGKFH